MKAWWFSAGRTLPHGDGRRIKLGVTHRVEGRIVPCKHGLHGSVRALDALQYAGGAVVWRVELGGEVVPHNDDKHAASERTYLAGGIDASETLSRFARLCALDVIHLWAAPEVVVRYRKTGDPEIRTAAEAAARTAAEAATWDASALALVASDLAWVATWVAAWSAAEAAARPAARAAAKAAQNRRLTRMLLAAIRKDQK